jgi:hypothetical protein
VRTSRAISDIAVLRIVLTTGRIRHTHCDPANPYERQHDRWGKGDYPRSGPWAVDSNEPVIADADDVSVGEGGAGVDTPVPHVDPVGGAQVGDHEAAPGVDVGSVVAADLAAGEDDVVVGAAADSGS